MVELGRSKRGAHALFVAALGLGMWLTSSMSDAAVLCRKNAGLHIRDTSCKANETLVTAADIGAVGPQGPSGVTGYNIHFGACRVLPDAPEHGFDTPGCAAGESVLGGGVGVFSDDICTSASGVAHVTFSGPVQNSPTLWVGDVLKVDPGTAYYQVSVVCATVE